MRISDWSSDVCSSDLHEIGDAAARRDRIAARPRREAREIVAADRGQFAHALPQPIAIEKRFDPAQRLWNLLANRVDLACQLRSEQHEGPREDRDNPRERQSKSDDADDPDLAAEPDRKDGDAGETVDEK